MKRILPLMLLVATGALAADSYMPTDAERARWTMQDMMSWKTVFEAYKTDYKAYPVVKTVDEARKAAEPVYIRHAPMTDAWGHPYRIESDGKTFTIVSAGADGVFNPDTWTTGGTATSFNDDAVVTNETRWWFRKWEFQ